MNDDDISFLGIGLLIKENIVITCGSLINNSNINKIVISHGKKVFSILEIDFYKKDIHIPDFLLEIENPIIKEMLLAHNNFCLLTLNEEVNNISKYKLKLEGLIFGYNNLFIKGGITYRFKIITMIDNCLTEFENIGEAMNNIIIFKYPQREVIIGSPILMVEKNLLCGFISINRNNMMIAYKFDDIKRIDLLKFDSINSQSMLSKTDYFVKYYRELERLQKINLVKTNFNYIDFSRMSSLFKFMKSLKFLNVSRIIPHYNKIYLSHALANLFFLNTLEYLCLKDCNIDEETSKYLSFSLENLIHLNTLILRNNKLGDNGLIEVVNSLKNLINLNELDMGNNNITVIGANYLDKNKDKLKNIKKLFLDKNSIPFQK